MATDNTVEIRIKTAPVGDLDTFALRACQDDNFGNANDWFGTFRGGLFGFDARIFGIKTHFRLVHSWVPEVRHPDEDGNIYVAAFLRYLSRLSPEHQLLWVYKQVERETHLHPDYFRTSIIGDWPERLSLYQAVLLEMKTANEMCEAIGRKPIFQNDFAEVGRPREFGYLLRPTLKEYNEFVHLLDKMLSENINREFFGTDVSFETEEPRKDGKIVVR